MRPFVIESIEPTRPWINGVQVHLDSPTDLQRSQLRYSLALRGWIVCAGERVTSIRLTWHGKRIAEAKVLVRPDVKAKYPNHHFVAGFRIDAVPAVFGEQEPLNIVVDTADGRSTTVSEIRLRFEQRDQAFEADSQEISIAPVLASARSGTTLLSSLLHSHPAVLGRREYPYESRLGIRLAEEWFANMQPAIYEPPLARGSNGIDQNLRAITEILDRPCAEDDGRMEHLFTSLRLQYRQRIIALYKMLTPSQSACVITEKLGVHWDLKLISGLFDRVRPIFIVRDPRDLLVSMRAFNERRGVYEFHESHAKNLDALLSIMSSNLRHLVRQYDEWKSDKLLIRYKDLIANPGDVLVRVLQFIGIDSSSQTVMNALEQANTHIAHITAASAEASVERWRSALTSSEVAKVNWFFEPFLRRFDYAE
ncbi:MAG: sulfotransferase [Rudaea sp.]